jgi:hypothetical protein
MMSPSKGGSTCVAAFRGISTVSALGTGGALRSDLRCATRRHVSGGGCETRRFGLSQHSGEAEGSLTEEVLGRVGSSPDNDGTRQHRQMVRARQARQRGVTIEPAVEPPQVWNRFQPGGCGPGSSARELHG